MRLRVFLSIAGLAVLSASGCGSSPRVRVTGQVVESGKPYPVPMDQSVQVTFYVLESRDPAVTKDEPFAAVVGAESRFEVPGAEGRGIPPGKYRVAVIRKRKSGAIRTVDATGKRYPDRDEDFLKDRFGPKTSPIVRDLSSSCELTIDLDRPES